MRRPTLPGFSTLLLRGVALGALLSGCLAPQPEHPSGSDGAGPIVDAGAGDASDGSAPFLPDSPATYVAKVKNVLVGLPPSDAELQAVTQDPSQLGALVDGWMALPQYQTKMQRFFELAFQQTQITTEDFNAMLVRSKLQIDSTPLLQAIQESFARTMVALTASSQPFNQAMVTRSYMMTTALEVFYALLDAWQVDDGGAVHDYFAAANPGISITVTAQGGPIPIAETLDPTNANYMHWYDPKVATACGADPQTLPAAANNLYDVLIGRLPGCKVSTGQLTASQFSDWRMVAITQPGAGQATTNFFDLTTLGAASPTLVLNRPYVGYFTTPAFFANWQTNDSNEMRVTMNQTLIVATGAQVDGTDTTIPTSTPGLDPSFPNDPACLNCHKLLDPTRSIFSATFSWNFGQQLDPTWSEQPGLFAFEHVQAPVSTLFDFAQVISTHPLVASGWVEKLCYYVNSAPCEASDPAFQQLVSAFSGGGYAWNALVKAVVTSPIVTHAQPTLTETRDGEVVAVARRDHLCAAWNARFGLADACGLDVTQKPVLPATALAIVTGLPSDGYGRGSVAPVLPNDPSLLYRAGTENLCEALAALLIDDASAPAGARTWSSAQPTPAIADFVSLVAGLPPSDPRAAALAALLTAHFQAASTAEGASAALQSTFVVACMSPSALSIGM